MIILTISHFVTDFIHVHWFRSSLFAWWQSLVGMSLGYQLVHTESAYVDRCRFRLKGNKQLIWIFRSTNASLRITCQYVNHHKTTRIIRTRVHTHTHTYFPSFTCESSNSCFLCLPVWQRSKSFIRIYFYMYDDTCRNFQSKFLLFQSPLNSNKTEINSLNRVGYRKNLRWLINEIVSMKGF